MKILVIDNYDSFTYNLVQYLGELGAEMEVFRNDQIGLAEIRRIGPERIVLSPGPGRPEGAGICMDLLKAFGGSIPVLGVCLGHQALGATFGGRIVSAPTLMHGKTSKIYHDGRTLFRGLSNPMTATRYHSLVVDRESLPSDFEISAQTQDGVIMGLRHRRYLAEGVQFHPESILTEGGRQLLQNFLNSRA